MKELSIEEKAKRYDEALEKARQLYAYPTTKPFISDLQDLFPELAESEDEKIRKAVVDAVVTLSDSPLKTKMLAWLEKQGEQKVTPKFRVGDIIKCKYDNRQFTIKSVDAEKGVYTYTEEGCGNDIDYADENFELVEQKSAEWSEKDDVMLDEIIDFFENGTVKLQHDLSLYASWLKSLKDRVQPMQEWSEEDNKIIEEIINDIECARAINYHAPKEGYEFRENWLKSLRPQKQWKPSEEQMEAMQKTLVDLCGKDEHNIITGLYYDLKKLREK